MHEIISSRSTRATAAAALSSKTEGKTGEILENFRSIFRRKIFLNAFSISLKSLYRVNISNFIRVQLTKLCGTREFFNLPHWRCALLNFSIVTV